MVGDTIKTPKQYQCHKDNHDLIPRHATDTRLLRCDIYSNNSTDNTISLNYV